MKRWMVAFLAAFTVLLSGHSVVGQDKEDGRPADIIGMLIPRSDDVGRDLALRMSDELSDGELRVIPIVSRGSWQSAIDLLHLDEIDLAFVQLDHLDYAKQIEVVAGIEEKIIPIARVNEVAVHLVARRSIETMGDLDGKRVNLGSAEDGLLTTGLLFDRLGIKVEPSDLPFSEALTALRTGKLDAAVFVGSVPIKDLQLVPWDDLLHLIPLPSVGEPYGNVRIGSKQYPGLMAFESVTDTITIPNILAAYGWPKDHPRYDQVDKFAEGIVRNLVRWKAIGPERSEWRAATAEQMSGWNRWGE